MSTSRILVNLSLFTCISLIIVLPVQGSGPFPQANVAIRVAPRSPLVLDGGGSLSPGGRRIRFWDWELLAGVRGTAGLPLRTQSPLLKLTRGLPAGNYVFGVRVTDAEGRVSAPATITVISGNRNWSRAVGDAALRMPPASVNRSYPNPQRPRTWNTRGPRVVQRPLGTRRPSADAGQDRYIAKGKPLTLDGSASRPGIAGRIVNYRWEKVSGPLVRVPLPLETPEPKVWIESHPKPGVYVFKLTVSDTSRQLSTPDEVRITVSNSSTIPPSSPRTTPSRPAPSPQSGVSVPPPPSDLSYAPRRPIPIPIPQTPVTRADAPKAHAGRDKTIRQRSPLELNASASKAATGRKITHYRWRKLEGPTLSIAFPLETTMPRIYLTDRPPVGTYVFKLVVIDSLGLNSAPTKVKRIVRR